MTADIVLWLAQDGITNGAIYALLALALLLVFSVTRVIFVPQGEFISYAALSLALLQAGQVPGVVYMLVGGGVIAAVFEGATAAARPHAAAAAAACSLGYVLLPCAMAALAWWAAPRKLDLAWQVLIVLGLVVPLGPIIYRVAFQPLANASVLVLLHRLDRGALHAAGPGPGVLRRRGVALGGRFPTRASSSAWWRRARRACWSSSRAWW